MSQYVCFAFTVSIGPYQTQAHREMRAEEGGSITNAFSIEDRARSK